MDDFHSSDVEFEPPPPNRFEQAGKASLESMLDHAFEDRVASKRQVKQLAYTKISPKTQYLQTLWWNRFTNFRKNTLNKHSDSTPASEELERFFTTIVNHVHPLNGKGVPSYGWLKQCIWTTVSNCIFHYKNFVLSPHERTRMTSLLHTLLKQGKVTQDTARERHWVGAVVVRKLVQSLLDQAEQQGTLAWDVTLSRCLSIVLAAATGARTGDLTVTAFDQHEVPYLAYQDVVIRMNKGGSTMEDLTAVVTIRNEKGSKLDPKKTRTVVLHALTSPSDSLVCPIKLLLIVALRFGNVPETSIEDLVEHTARRRNRTLVWSFPKRPVLCAFASISTAVLPDVPAHSTQLGDTMAKASLAAGLLTQLHSHDLRRGAARDTANLTSKSTGLPNKAATSILGHDTSALNRPLTAHYVGGHDDDVWTKRIDCNYEDGMYELPQAKGPFQRGPRRTKEAVTESCLHQGLNVSSRTDRASARRVLDKRRHADWVDEEKENRLLLDTTDVAAAAAAATIPPPTNMSEVDATGDKDDHDDDAFPIDPRLLQESQQVCDIILGLADGMVNANVESLLFDSVQGLASSPTDLPETRTTLSFVRHFSTINITRNQAMHKGPGHRNKVISLIQGNSRDPVTSFMYVCKNKVHGCTYQKAVRSDISHHELVCPVSSRAAFEELAAKDLAKTIKCTEPGCPASFASVVKRKAHVKLMHTWPKVCPKGCSELFHTIGKLQTHLLTMHSNFKPSTCLVPGCESKNIFNRSLGYRRHIQRMHKIFGKDIDKYMPYERKKGRFRRKCTVPGCSNRITFRYPKAYKDHLRSEHSILDDDEIEQHLAG